MIGTIEQPPFIEQMCNPLAFGIIPIVPARTFGDVHTPGFGDMYSGLIQSDRLGGVHNLGKGEIGTNPVRSCGIMEGGVIGEIPIGPARFCGDIYAPELFGDIHAGLWVGYMITGAALRPGDMETT